MISNLSVSRTDGKENKLNATARFQMLEYRPARWTIFQHLKTGSRVKFVLFSIGPGD